MAVIVQKFGGTSVADPQKILRCARRAVEARQLGHDVVVVVSAMGQATDELIKLAEQVTAGAATLRAGTPDSESRGTSPREMDMLLATGEQVSIALMAMAIQSLGVDAVSMTGSQMGMMTDPIHTRARIQSIDTERIWRELKAGRIVVAAGFQGVTEDGQITTLGRGGSDTTAVALAAALGVGQGQARLSTDDADGADRASSSKNRPSSSVSSAPSVDNALGVCEIYTDVDGVYTADPRIVPNARKLNRISYEEMLELASSGAAVMQTRSVMFGQKFGVPIHVRHSGKPDPGTLISKETLEMEDIVVAGCALKRDLGRISLRRIPNRAGVQGMIFGLIGQANVVVDDIIQTTHEDTASLSFTVDHHDLADVKIAAGKAIEQLDTGELAVEIGLAKVSVAGVGMRNHSGVAATMFKALGDAGINIVNITTSDIKISCIVPKEHGERALQVVHDAFKLDKPQASKASTAGKALPETKPTARNRVPAR